MVSKLLLLGVELATSFRGRVELATSFRCRLELATSGKGKS